LLREAAIRVVDAVVASGTRAWFCRLRVWGRQAAAAGQLEAKSPHVSMTVCRRCSGLGTRAMILSGSSWRVSCGSWRRRVHLPSMTVATSYGAGGSDRVVSGFGAHHSVF
jgi:hypothetical protein